ncbi:MAG TPA: hypothetical protein VM198_02550 [Longimicrobiales bacterium]|nr:hypothetical protein [Longimicrobiales bacterium]
MRHRPDGQILDVGETSLANTVLLCRQHHTLVHEGGWRIEWWGEGRPAFYGPRGQMLFEGRWRPPALPDDPVEALVHEQRLRGVEPDAATAGARWRREEDVPAEVWLAAAEALL